jgi:type I restriction enzyme S subunit
LLVQTGDVARSKGVIETFTAKYNEFGLAQSAKWPRGTLCITIAANIADSGILSFDACFPDSVVGFVPASMFPNARYFEYFLRTVKDDLLEFAPATAQKNINIGILNAVLIPLPPLAEQRRIIAKVDELMALCDQLEAQLSTTKADSRRLLEAVLHEALAPTLEETA